MPTTVPTEGDVLVVTAHPDDETLGCGGTISKLVREGAQVTALLALRRTDPRGVEHWDRLMTHFDAACARLGARAALADPLLTEVRAEPEVGLLSDTILPWVQGHQHVITHWNGDVHQAHRGVSRAVEIATRPFRRRIDVWMFEVATSSDQAFAPAFGPTAWVVLDEQSREDKIAAMAVYETELDHGRRPVDLDRQLSTRGATIGVDCAEAFVVARQFR